MYNTRNPELDFEASKRATSTPAAGADVAFFRKQYAQSTY